MSDIVERLRNRNGRPDGFGIGPVCDEAANEIERLRAEVAVLREDVEGWKESRGMFVARLDMAKQGDKWLTITAVMMLLNDCDRLAARKGEA